MLSAIRSYLLPIIKLYLLGLKVLLVQLFSRSFRLPGGRDEREGLAAVRTICEEYKEAKVEFSKLDLASLESVRQFVKSFKERDLPLNILVNNAGVMLIPEGRTEDGFEQHFGVNYLGHFLLTWLLLDTLKVSGKCGNFSRVVNVSSSAHRIGEIRLNDLNSCVIQPMLLIVPVSWPSCYSVPTSTRICSVEVSH
ncbi:hypothetical protein FQN60_001464 [Etheostoma spectabile]|uniref:Dehydrogenase/reductase SDR family member on chromosome X n=1 Tax=Etheostoma spectabile TaxID=54343 RepID=A0A5J5D5P9_9PERO|nr:hypothetical protein FQN60_001464 [Etheostoma spectabile]